MVTRQTGDAAADPPGLLTRLGSSAVRREPPTMPPKSTEMTPQRKNRLKIWRSRPLREGFLHSSCAAGMPSGGSHHWRGHAAYMRRHSSSRCGMPCIYRLSTSLAASGTPFLTCNMGGDIAACGSTCGHAAPL